MKKVFKYTGILTLLLFSFVFTEKTAYVAINQDDLMKQIDDVKESYNIEIIEPIIGENTFIPGICGTSVDSLESYRKLKKIGVFNEGLLVFKDVCPKETLENNKDKFIISGNHNIKSVSLIFLAQNQSNLGALLKILDDNQVSANIFVDLSLLDSNNNLIYDLSKKHVIGNLSYNGDYSDPSFIWMTAIIKKFNDNFCYTEEFDENILDICSKNNSYTIVPNFTIKTNPTLNLSKRLKNGSIIAFYLNEEVISELSLMIKYIKNKGYEIVTLSSLLNELS